MTYVVRFRGLPACPCLAQWLPVYEAELKRRGVIRNNVDIAQLIGGAKASGGTHSNGGAFDIWQTGSTVESVAREMGAATWSRTRAQGFSPHAHGVLNGCPHNGPARYQITALSAGFNGLGRGGRGARDDGAGPRQLRTWSAGIQWARAQQGAGGASKPATNKTKGEDEMAIVVRVAKRHLFTVSHGKVTHWPGSVSKMAGYLVNVLTVEDRFHEARNNAEFNGILAVNGVPAAAADGERGVVRDASTGKVGPGLTWSRDESMLADRLAKLEKLVAKK